MAVYTGNTTVWLLSSKSNLRQSITNTLLSISMHTQNTCFQNDITTYHFYACKHTQKRSSQFYTYRKWQCFHLCSHTVLVYTPPHSPGLIPVCTLECCVSVAAVQAGDSWSRQGAWGGAWWRKRGSSCHWCRCRTALGTLQQCCWWSGGGGAGWALYRCNAIKWQSSVQEYMRKEISHIHTYVGTCMRLGWVKPYNLVVCGRNQASPNLEHCLFGHLHSPILCAMM